jgi:hypothetical protein
MPKVGQTFDRLSTALRLPQLKVLAALGSSSLRREDLAAKAKFRPKTGTINAALHGVKEGSSTGSPRPGLLEMGMVDRIELDIDGLVELRYVATDKGKAALARWLDEHGPLPVGRDKDASVNRRYLSNG